MGASQYQSLDDFLLFLWLFPESGGSGGEAWVRSLFGITEPLCLPSPSHLPPVSILENDFKRVGGGGRRGGWREVTVPGERSVFHRSEKIQKEHSQERAQR